MGRVSVMPGSTLETQFALQLSRAGLPAPERELRFHPARKWRLDFAWPAALVAVEIDGGTWAQGRHTRGRGYEADCEKAAEAALAGWMVLRVTGGQVRSGQALDWLSRALSAFHEDQQEKRTKPHES